MVWLTTHTLRWCLLVYTASLWGLRRALTTHNSQDGGSARHPPLTLSLLNCWGHSVPALGAFLNWCRECFQNASLPTYLFFLSLFLCFFVSEGSASIFVECDKSWLAVVLTSSLTHTILIQIFGRKIKNLMIRWKQTYTVCHWCIFAKLVIKFELPLLLRAANERFLGVELELKVHFEPN